MTSTIARADGTSTPSVKEGYEVNRPITDALPVAPPDLGRAPTIRGTRPAGWRAERDHSAKEISRSVGEAPQDERDVLPAETETVGQRHLDRLLAGHVRDIVQVALGVRVIQVDRRRHDPVAHRQQADDRLDTAGGGDQVPHHALGAGDGDA